LSLLPLFTFPLSIPNSAAERHHLFTSSVATGLTPLSALPSLPYPPPSANPPTLITMPSLLDPPDEHLIIIGSLLNPETYLPLPSWKPFWNASKSPLDRKSTRDLRAFRATCTRIRGAVKLDGQFLEIQRARAMEFCRYFPSLPKFDRPLLSQRRYERRRV
jgi:hypothetical protein